MVCFIIPVVSGGGAAIKAADRLDAAKAGKTTEIPLLETTKPISGKTNDHHIIPAFRGKSIGCFFPRAWNLRTNSAFGLHS